MNINDAWSGQAVSNKALEHILPPFAMEDQQGHVSLKTRSSSALWTFAIAILCHSLRTLQSTLLKNKNCRIAYKICVRLINMHQLFL